MTASLFEVPGFDFFFLPHFFGASPDPLVAVSALLTDFHDSCTSIHDSRSLSGLPGDDFSLPDFGAPLPD